MKQSLLWVMGSIGVSVAVMVALQAQENQATPPTAESPSSTAPQEHVVFTFADDAQMRQFAQLWQQRQGMMARMVVLQGYWNQEQASLAKLNEQLLDQYHHDVAKNYALDSERKVLVEQPLAAGQPATGSQPLPAASEQPKPSIP